MQHKVALTWSLKLYPTTKMMLPTFRSYLAGSRKISERKLSVAGYLGNKQTSDLFNQFHAEVFHQLHFILLSVSIFQDDSSWEGVCGAWGWKLIPWQTELIRNSGAFSPDQMFCVCHTEACVFI